ncbi:CD28 antigen [Cricetulus griseus]
MLVVDNNDVTLSCRYSHNLLSKEFRASLYKGVNSDVEVCVVNVNFSYQLQFHSNVGFNCDGNLDNETVTFYLRNLHVNQTDIYFCRIEVMYPPPYLDNEKSNGTIIHVKGNMQLYLCLTMLKSRLGNDASSYFECLYLSSLTRGRVREEVTVNGNRPYKTILDSKKHLCPDQETPKLLWVLIGGAGVLFLYGLVVTVALCIIWKNSKRNRLLQSDYMNMTPRRLGPTRKHYQPYAPARDFAAYSP